MRDVAVIHPGLEIGEGGPAHDGVKPLLEVMDGRGIERAMIPVDLDRPEAQRALKDHPDRFFGCYRLDPNRGMDEVRKVVALYERLDIRALFLAPALLVPQVPIDDGRLYPFYAKAVELGLPLACRAGVPPEPVPMLCQHPGRLDEVCAFFPELRLMLWDDGVGPWERLVAMLLRRRPNLHFASSGGIPEPILRHAHAGGAGQLLFAGGGLDAPMRDDVRTCFLRDNARRLFQLS